MAEGGLDQLDLGFGEPQANVSQSQTGLTLWQGIREGPLIETAVLASCQCSGWSPKPRRGDDH